MRENPPSLPFPSLLSLPFLFLLSPLFYSLPLLSFQFALSLLSMASVSESKKMFDVDES
jgi:hypothetical protein